MTVPAFATAHTTKVQNSRLRLLNTLKRDEFALMTSMAIPSVRHAQIVALCDFDVGPPMIGKRQADSVQGVIIDCEHGHIGDDNMHNAVSAIAALDCSPIIRVRGTSPDILKRALDTGAH